jgi:hypothetical protein
MAKVTQLGMLPKDHPIFKEGFSIQFRGKSQKSIEASQTDTAGTTPPDSSQTPKTQQE